VPQKIVRRRIAGGGDIAGLSHVDQAALLKAGQEAMKAVSGGSRLTDMLMRELLCLVSRLPMTA
jgi:hypothetical protein